MFEEFDNPVSEVLMEYGIKRPVKLLASPSPELGDFCFVVNQIAGQENPVELADKLKVKLIEIEGISSVSVFNAGNKKREIIYLNFSIEEATKQMIQTDLVKRVIQYVHTTEYGYLDENKGKSVIVEHTSANPISPIHVGNLRNSVQGDTFARILRHSGYEVFIHYYVNDVGLQIGFVVVGYELAKARGVRPPIKIDLWTGQIYAIMNCLYTIQKLKNNAASRKVSVSSTYQLLLEEIEMMTDAINEELTTVVSQIDLVQNKTKQSGQEKQKLKELKRSRNKLEEERTDILKYSKTFDDLKYRFNDLFELLFEEVSKIDLVTHVATYLKAYENNSDQIVTDTFREVTMWVLSAFEWSLRRFNIEFDQFDFESDVTWSGKPNQLIDELAKSKNAEVDGLAVRYSYPSTAMKEFMKAAGWTKKDLAIRGQIPELQLRRSDGTALYAAKDIAYSLNKFEDKNPDRIYNVISTEQILPQFQMLLPLHELGYTKEAANLIHYAYDNVDLLGRTMSGRLAKYITADEYFDESYIRARMAKRMADAERNIDLPKTDKEWQQENEILLAVTLASTRFPLIETNPKKRIELDLDRELDFKRNAGPFVQYAHARSNSLLEKVKEEKNWELSITKIDYSKVTDYEIVEICNHLNALAQQILLALAEEDPSKIANWVFHLAQLFMKFYEKFPVLKAEDSVAKARTVVVQAIQKGLATGLKILGIIPAIRL